MVAVPLGQSRRYGLRRSGRFGESWTAVVWRFRLRRTPWRLGAGAPREDGVITRPLASPFRAAVAEVSGVQRGRISTLVGASRLNPSLPLRAAPSGVLRRRAFYDAGS